MDFPSLYRNAPVLLHVTDPTGNVLSANGAWLDKFGYTEHELVGCSALGLVHESHKSSLREALHTLGNGGRRQQLALAFNTKRGDVIETDTLASMSSSDNGDAYIIGR